MHTHDTRSTGRPCRSGRASAGDALARAVKGALRQSKDSMAHMLVHGHRRSHPMEFTGDTLVVGDFLWHDEDELIAVIERTLEVDLGAGPPAAVRADD